MVYNDTVLHANISIISPQKGHSHSNSYLKQLEYVTKGHIASIANNIVLNLEQLYYLVLLAP